MFARYRNRLVGGMAVGAFAVAPAAMADDYTWVGLNTVEPLGAIPGDVNDEFNWEPFDFVIPGPGDTAIFAWETAADESVRGDIDITAGAFNPDTIVLVGTGNTNRESLNILTDLELQTLDVTTGRTTAIFATVNVGSEDGLSPNTLTMTGESPFAFAGPQGGWKAIVLNDGSTLEFAGDTHVFDEYNDGGYYHTGNGTYYAIDGSLQGNGTVEFTAVGGSITLGDPGTTRPHRDEDYKPAGAINLGQQQLWVRSDQTWNNPTGTGAVQLLVADGDSMVNAIDGAPLHNLGDVPFVIWGHLDDGNEVLVDEGTYQSIHYRSDLHFQALGGTLVLTGDVTLAGGTVLPGNEEVVEDDVVVIPAQDAQESDFSLVLHSSRSPRTDANLQGHELTLERGLMFLGTGEGNTGLIDRIPQGTIFDASGSIVHVGGDLVMDSAWAGGTQWESGDETLLLRETRNVIRGDADTVINLAGSFSTNTPSHTGQGFQDSTLNLIGMGNTFEVASNAAHDVFSDDEEASTNGRYAIGNLNVGTSSDTASIQLVNDFVNDGSVSVDIDGNESRSNDDEVLLTNNLSIAAGSTLDVNGQGVAVWGSLSIDATGTLDLNTGVTLNDEDIVTSFFGVGNQAAAWNAVASQVMDSSNPDAEFSAIFQNDNTYWQVGEATGPLLGDMNLDGVVDAVDVAPFVLALTNPGEYQNQHGIDPVLVGDINNDGALDAVDVAPFVQLLVGGGGDAVAIPEPGSLALLGLGGLALLRRKRVA